MHSANLQMTTSRVLPLTHLRDRVPSRRTWASSRSGPLGIGTRWSLTSLPIQAILRFYYIPTLFSELTFLARTVLFQLSGYNWFMCNIALFSVCLNILIPCLLFHFLLKSLKNLWQHRLHCSVRTQKCVWLAEIMPLNEP